MGIPMATRVRTYLRSRIASLFGVDQFRTGRRASSEEPGILRRWIRSLYVRVEHSPK